MQTPVRKCTRAAYLHRNRQSATSRRNKWEHSYVLSVGQGDSHATTSRYYEACCVQSRTPTGISSRGRCSGSLADTYCGSNEKVQSPTRAHNRIPTQLTPSHCSVTKTTNKRPHHRIHACLFLPWRILPLLESRDKRFFATIVPNSPANSRHMRKGEGMRAPSCRCVKQKSPVVVCRVGREMKSEGGDEDEWEGASVCIGQCAQSIPDRGAKYFKRRNAVEAREICA